MDRHDAFTLLSNADRYAVVRHLVEAGGVATLTDLAEVIAARFEEATTGQARVSLLHNHVPKLREAGVVEYRGGAVMLSDEGWELEPLLEAAERLDDDGPGTSGGAEPPDPVDRR